MMRWLSAMPALLVFVTSVTARAQISEPPDIAAVCGPDTKSRRENVVPRLTASVELNELVREYWKIGDDLRGASQVATLYGGFYAANSFFRGEGRPVAGPMLSLRLSLVSSRNPVAQERAWMGKDRILRYALPEVIRGLESRKEELETDIRTTRAQKDKAARQATSPEPASPDVTSTLPSRAQYIEEVQAFADRKIQARCDAWRNTLEALATANEWKKKLAIEVERSEGDSFVGFVGRLLVPTSLQFGIGYGLRIGDAIDSAEPAGLTTGHAGIMTNAGRGAVSIGLALAQNNYVGLYCSIGTDLGFH